LSSEPLFEILNEIAFAIFKSHHCYVVSIVLWQS